MLICTQLIVVIIIIKAEKSSLMLFDTICGNRDTLMILWLLVSSKG